ncbi:tyrosine-type recombinase/integrase [Paenibacillus alvei]|uniref:site-specific integrase n=1 Tax=Paenibacillus alvei TaxID=44250 RepID=UPI0002897F96|nr:site-specific integrase [Paenibacillus alvei]EJW14131.1 integrase Int [Paenibacillus alvei DSM 29]MCY7486375.1 tyrosine-type recombinase/integrase [Paenibacillus alvei]MCY9544869.1 tyrosine-type recombinase/integrase [Paenibacillus alvei]MCY9708016.1 tyrosine-type recombinase/integrase [Paenibacillus alvei]MCY9736250.1 tyrosine-type recombinase/integrase [Paenibacillus alvei]
MDGSFRQRNCKCPPERKRCTCGAKWHYRYDIIDPVTGKRKQKETRGFRTKTEAEAEAKRIQYELQDGTYIEEKDVTFDDFAETWLELYKKTGVKISTVRVRCHEIGRLSTRLGKIKMKDITKQQYQKALDDFFEEGLAENTIDGIHRTGRMIFKKAVELEVIKKDPSEYATPPKRLVTIEEIEQGDDIPKYLEKEELAHFLNTAKEHGLDRDYEIFLTLAYTGIRAGELCALQEQNIDFKELTISIFKTYYNPNNNIKQYILLTPKTKTSRRIIDIDEFVLDVLSKLIYKQNEIKCRYKSTYHDKGFVFAQQNEEYAGYPPYVKLIENRMERLLKISGLNPNLTPHSLRHTHTSLLAEAGVSLEQIMHRLGHSDDSTTRNIYLHVTKPKRKEASHKFAELMRSF